MPSASFHTASMSPQVVFCGEVLKANRMPSSSQSPHGLAAPGPSPTAAAPHAQIAQSVSAWLITAEAAAAAPIGGSVNGLLGLPLLLRVMPSSEQSEADLRVGPVRPVCSRSVSVVGPGCRRLRHANPTRCMRHERTPGALPVEDLLPQDVCVPAVLGEFADRKSTRL